VKAHPLEGATEHAVIVRADSGRPVIAVTKSEVAARALWKALNERFPVVTKEHSDPRSLTPADGSALIWWAPGNIIRAEGNTEVIARMRFFAEGFLLNTTGHA
jgi:hypothetical protein